MLYRLVFVNVKQNCCLSSLSLVIRCTMQMKQNNPTDSPLSSGVTDKSSFWDSKTRGANGGQKGELLWDLDAISHCFTDSK